jgi:hypothetical protein
MLSGKILTASKLRQEPGEGKQPDSGLQPLSINHPKSRSYRASVQAASWRQCQASISAPALHPPNWIKPQHGATYGVGAVLLLVVCKGPAYGVSLGSFRGGSVFPAMFACAAYCSAMSHLARLRLVAGGGHGQGRDARGNAAPSADLGSAGHCRARLGLLAVMLLVIVAVVVAYMAGQGSRRGKPPNPPGPRPAARAEAGGGRYLDDELAPAPPRRPRRLSRWCSAWRSRRTQGSQRLVS